jgi:hypothetical protein
MVFCIACTMALSSAISLSSAEAGGATARIARATKVDNFVSLFIGERGDEVGFVRKRYEAREVIFPAHTRR